MSAELINGIYIIAAVLFIFGLKKMSHPTTARGGVVWAGLGMVVATIITYLEPGMNNYLLMTTAIFIGGVLAWWLTVAAPMQWSTGLPVIFIAGSIAICAMILPGISGAFILLILGKYEFITATLKNPFLPQNLVIIVVFCLGCLIGLLSFARLLNYMLKTPRLSM